MSIERQVDGIESVFFFTPGTSEIDVVERKSVTSVEHTAK